MPAKKSVTFETTVVALGDKVVYHFLAVEKEWVAPLEFKGNLRRAICTVNGKATFHCSLMGNGKGGYLITFNKENRDKAGVVPGGSAKVKLVRDESKYGLPMPDELKEVLNQDPEGNELFESLTSGRQRSIIYYVTRSKDIDLRIHHALIILDHIKRNEGKIDEKALYKELRRPML